MTLWCPGASAASTLVERKSMSLNRSQKPSGERAALVITAGFIGCKLAALAALRFPLGRRPRTFVPVLERRHPHAIRALRSRRRPAAPIADSRSLGARHLALRASDRTRAVSAAVRDGS